MHLDGGEPLTIAADKQGNIIGIGDIEEMTFLEGDKKLNLSEDSQNQSGGKIIKYNNNGKIEWAQLLTYFGNVDNIAADEAGNIYTPYYTNDQIYLLGYNGIGQLIAKQKIGENIRGTIQTDGNGNMYLSGKFTNQAKVGNTTLTGDDTDKYYSVLAKFKLNSNVQPVIEE